MAFLVFVDQLGSRAKWHDGGSELALKHFSRFEQLVRLTIERLKPATLKGGLIENDALALVFSALPDAFNFAGDLFRSAFMVDRSRRLGERTNYVWLRGTIVPFNGDLSLRKEEPLVLNSHTIAVTRFPKSLLDAIAIEKSSFKGMRFLVCEGPSLTRQRRRSATRFLHRDVGIDVSTFARLERAMYPGRLADNYFDFLWMSCETTEAWRRIRGIMDRKLHFTAANQEEFMHAAATRLVFFAAEYKFNKQAARKKKS